MLFWKESPLQSLGLAIFSKSILCFRAEVQEEECQIADGYTLEYSNFEWKIYLRLNTHFQWDPTEKSYKCFSSSTDACNRVHVLL